MTPQQDTELLKQILILDDNCLKLPGEHCGSCLQDFEDNFDSDLNCCSHIKWRDEAIQALASWKDKEVRLARIDENESLLSVAEHEIELPDHCDMHDKHSGHCHACKKRKWYGEISKDWKRVIEERLESLQSQGGKK